MLDRFLKTLLRKKTPVNFADLGSTKPISSVFGLDRGTSIDRYYIEKFLEANSRFIKDRVIEVGESLYSKRFGAGAEVFDVLHYKEGNPMATIVGDLTDIKTLPENRVDCFICTQTLNFIFDVGKAVAGAHHMLKPGGVLLATVAGICQISRYDMERWGDYWRFTSLSAKRLFEPVFKGGVEVKSYGNVLAAIAFLQGIAVEDLPDISLLDASDPDYQLVIAIVAKKATR